MRSEPVPLYYYEISYNFVACEDLGTDAGMIWKFQYNSPMSAPLEPKVEYLNLAAGTWLYRYCSSAAVRLPSGTGTSAGTRRGIIHTNASKDQFDSAGTVWTPS